MRQTLVLACAGAALLGGCQTMQPAERQYLDAEAKRMEQRPAGALVAGCVVTPVPQGLAQLTDASQRLATGFGTALNAQLASADRPVTKTNTPKLCVPETAPTAEDLPAAYGRLLGALAAVKKANAYESFASVMGPPSARHETMKETSARRPLTLTDADVQLLTAEFAATDLWVLQASGRSVDMQSVLLGNLAGAAIAALVGSSSAPTSNERNDLRYEISLVDLERREVVWMKLGRPIQTDPESADVIKDERFSTLLEPFLAGAAPAP